MIVDSQSAYIVVIINKKLWDSTWIYFYISWRVDAWNIINTFY